MQKRPSARDREVGRRVRALRIQRGMSQTTLGDGLGLTFQQVQKYEKGTNRIGAGRLQQIAEILEVPVTVFFDISNTPSKPLLELVNTAAALRLLQAYDRIESPAARSALVKLAESMAGATDQHG
jgi:transcriptional regulator with XRE-family HTH domain